MFAWDLRWPQQPIVLSGLGAGNTEHSPSESEVWEVQYDRFAKSSNVGNISSSRILPAMICSEDGILSVVEQGISLISLLLDGELSTLEAYVIFTLLNFNFSIVGQKILLKLE